MTKISFSAFTFLLFCLCANIQAVEPPNIKFNTGGVGLNAPLQTDMSVLNYGLAQYVGGGWLFDGDAARTSSSRYVRYQTSVQGASTARAMPTNQDWLVVVEYKHTGGYAMIEQPWLLKNYGSDVKIIMLSNDGGGDRWSIKKGNSTNTAWETVLSDISLGVYWNTFKIHYKSSVHKIDVYLNNNLITDNITLEHGRYDLDHVQLEWIGAGTDWFGKVEIAGAIANTRSLTFGHEWVRSHPFIIQGLVLRPDSLDDPKYRKCNFTNVMCWENNVGLMDKAKEKQGLHWHWHIGDERQLDSTLIAELNNYLQNRPGGTGIISPDEPMRPTFHDVRKIYDWMHENYPDVLVYGNFDAALNPNRPGSNYGQEYGTAYIPGVGYEDPPVPYDYNTFVDDYLHVVYPDILLVDAYPFSDSENDETTEQYLRERSYFRQLDLVRAAAMQANIPYWIIVQSVDYGGVYLPSESDLRMQIFSSLAYGFTGISYFVFDNLGNYGNGDGGLLRYVDANEISYVENPIYFYAQQVNKEIQNLGNIPANRTPVKKS